MSFRKAYYIFAFLAILVCSLIFNISKVDASTVSAPTVLELGSIRNENGIGAPFIKGLTYAGTEVLVYIDGSFISLAQVASGDTETDSFFYQYPSVLNSEHRITVIARDLTSLVLSAPIDLDFAAPELPAPTLVFPDEDNVISNVKPLIIGLTVSNTTVHVYIDGVYNGKITPELHRSGTANFAYKPFLNLNPGNHQVYAIVEDKFGQKSKISNILNFKISPKTPAPIVIKPENKSVNSTQRAVITGLSKNDLLIKVFVDHKLDGQFQVVNNESGTANFAYQTFLPLTKGEHIAYTTATDIQGKESEWSNIVYFSVKLPAISDLAPSEVKGIKDVMIDVEENEVVDITDEDIKKIIDDPDIEDEDEKGLLNENQEGQSKLKLNLIIFIAFLFGIIAWIFWVNKELIKERKSE